MSTDFPAPIATGRYIDLGTLNVPSGGSNFSWTGWMKLRNRGGEKNPMITKADATGIFEPDWELAIQGSGPAELFASLDTGSGTDRLDGGNFFVGAPPHIWHMISMTYDGTTKRSYIDAAEVASTGQTGNVVNTAEAVAMGALNAGATIERQIDGFIEDVRIYERTLSVAELETMFVLLGMDGIVDGLLHRWTMREWAPGVTASGVGATKDAGPSQFNGTPLNSPVGGESGLRL